MIRAIILFISCTALIYLPPATANEAEAPSDTSDEEVESPAEPTSRHQRYMDQLALKIAPKEQWWLESADGEKTLSLYRRDMTGTTQGAVLILSKPGHHADWPGLISTLRHDLPWQGWHSLSLALPPIKLPDSSDTEAALEAITVHQKLISPLLDQAILKLTEKNLMNIVVIAEGESSWWAASWLQQQQPVTVQALVMVSAMAPVRPKHLDYDTALKKLNRLQLDLLLSANDSLALSRLREGAARSGGQSYHRLQLHMPAHQTVSKRLGDWLTRHLQGSLINTAQ